MQRVRLTENACSWPATTLAGGFEAAIHATGRYPDWWKGKRFDKPRRRRVGNDLMAATRYALMMLRYARTEKERRNFHREIEYPSMGRF